MDARTKRGVAWLRKVLPDYLATLPDSDEDRIYTDSRSLAKEQIEGLLNLLDPQPATPEDEIAALKQRVAQLEADNLRKQREIEDKQQEIDSWKL